MNYGDLNAALQRFLRWGSPNMSGLEQLLKQLREARERELGRYNLDTTVEELRQKVQDVIDTERQGIERRLKEAAPEARKLLDRIARQRNDQLDRLPDDLGGRVKGLRNYEFVDDEARQKVEALMQSLSPEAREELRQMMDAILQDDSLRLELARLSGFMQAMMPPSELSERYPFFGEDPLTLGQAMGLMERMQQMDRLESQLERGSFRPDDVDRSLAQQLLGPEARQALDQLRQVTDVLEKAGYVERKGRRLELTPRGMRRIGQSALRDIFDQLKKTR